MAPIRNDVTRGVMARHGWLADLAIVDLLGEPALLLGGTLQGHSVSTYVGDMLLDVRDADSIEGLVRSIETDPDPDRMTDASLVDAYVEQVSAMEHLECVGIEPYTVGSAPTIAMIAPGIGRVSQEIDDKPLEKHLARLRKRRRQDSEGRTITAFGAMSLALVAEDAADLDRILDTAFAADDVTYRGVHMRITRSTHVLTTVRSGSMLVLPDGIEILDLPETIKLALRSGDLDGQPLARVADMPGFGALRIGTINRQTSVNRLTAGGGGGWIKIHVRDQHRAAFDDLEIEDARAIAQETLARRRDELAKTEDAR